jgi:AcrR family transcriptional regulator
MILRVALALAVVVAGLNGFLLWGRGLATPVSPERAAASFLTGRPAAAGDLPGPRPPAGVYRYRTSGHERVDRFGIDRAYPAETARVISWRGGCRWRETVPIFTQHTETYDFCAAGTDAADLAYSTSLTYFLVPGVQRFACAPVGRRLLSGQRPGAARRWRCVQGASTSANTTIYVGPETVQTAAGPVATRHLRLITALSGQSSGGAVRELWLDPDGLVVKEERQVSLRVRSTFVGVLTYEERASFLLSGRPQPISGRLFQRLASSREGWMARTGRRPGVSGTREAILDAARRSFAEHGYQHATIRGVADLAGVDPALVHHYFGTKQRLFVAAVQLPLNPAEQLMAVLGDDPEQAGRRLVETFLLVWDRAADQSPLLALVRSAVGDERAAAMLREFITEEVLGQIARRLGSPDARLRATLVGSQVVGLIMLRYIIRVEPLASAPADQVVAAVGPTLQRYLTGDVAAAPAPA